MTLDATTYYRHLKAYLNSEYVTQEVASGSVILTEKYFAPDDPKPKTRRIELFLPGAGMVFKLDHDEWSNKNNTKSKKGNKKPPLFHFLDDNAKHWSKRCDFVVFYVFGSIRESH